LRQREKDIEELDLALNDLKQTMSDEFGNKQREFEKLRKSFEDLML
jgi:hypothetical protein